MAELEVYKREDALFDWRLVADNGRTLSGSTQGYTERNDAAEGLARTIDAICNDILELGRIEDLDRTTIIFEAKVIPQASYEGSAPDQDEVIALSVELTAPEVEEELAPDTSRMMTNEEPFETTKNEVTPEPNPED